MASGPSVEDVEAGDAEFERIKQNFRSTVVAPDVSPNLPETQTAFQELQLELQEFLRDHLNKVKDLQAFLLNNVAPSESNGAAHESHGTVTPRRRTLSLHPVDTDPSQPVDEGLSTSTVSHQGISRSRSVGADKAPLSTHVQALDSFLNAHAENIRMLQSNLQGSTNTKTSTYGHAPPYKQTLAEPPNTNEKHFESLNQQFTMLVIISTFTAALIVAFLSLVYSIIGPTHKTAFNIGMLFSFMALLIYFGNIIIAGRGAAITAQPDREHDLPYFKFYLTTCEQLQFFALILFIVSVTIMAFLIFISVAFPIVLLFFSAIGIAIVFSSTYWKVSITSRNLRYLAKNFHRIRQSLEYLRIQARAGRDG
ncbi:hypothetical protein GALMADRAFT_764789 [Galerina marginata CBS 339.88]|uniref:Uncharacterized protein n=1 Tax=Galerina marginata (strain CBS 339.88) TaxID=685588 RepID=A0A067T154_GALM3|nr:hypothetical protein GALMADRAFT_764789 [Galerina marginata CBS 339.88]